MLRKMSRGMTAKGGITIPKAARDAYGLDGKQFEIEVNERGQLVLTPFTRSCALCGARDPKVEPLYGKYVCEACRAALAEE